MSALQKYKKEVLVLREENEKLKEEVSLWKKRAESIFSYMKIPIGDIAGLDRWASILQEVWPGAFAKMKKGNQKMSMKTVSRYTLNDIYTLCFDLVDCKGKVMRQSVFSWASKSLLLLLLIEKAILRDGIEYVERAWSNAGDLEKSQDPDIRIKKSQERFMEEILTTNECV